MKKLLILSGLITALAVVAAPEGYVAKSATGTTSATVYFEPGARDSLLVAADVTSDKAASLLSWRVGLNPVSLLTTANNVTNLTVTTGTIPASTNLVSVTANGTLAAHTSHSTTQITNKLVTLANAISTNMASGSTLRELTGTSYEVTAFSSTNLVSISTNSLVTNAVIYLLQGGPNTWQTNRLTSYTTNGANYVLSFTNAIPFTPSRVAALNTNIYTLNFAAASGATTLVLDTTNGLATGDNLVLLPTTGGAFPAQLLLAEDYRYQTLNLTATNGVTFAVGDRLFLLNTAVTTPVGAASLRLFSEAVRVLPANVPGVLSLDGTSAVTINTAVMKY